MQSRGGGTEAERSEFLFCAPGKFYYVGSSCEPQNWEVWQKESVKIPSNAIVVHGDCGDSGDFGVQRRLGGGPTITGRSGDAGFSTSDQSDKRTWPGWLVVVGHCWWFVKFVHFIFTKRSLVRFLADETKYRETNFSLNLPQLTCSVNVQSACRLACLCRLATEHQKRKIQFC